MQLIKNRICLFLLLLIFHACIFNLIFAQKLEVKSSLTDFGKMWTFDYPPVDHFNKTYNFTPDKLWFEKARLSSLRLPGCSGGFVSEDGLVITNHHCARGSLVSVSKPGENLIQNGFFAPTLEEERKVPNLFIDQLALIEDVTEKVQAAFESGKTDQEKIKNREEMMKKIEDDYKSKTGLICDVITFYNGGKYSVYGYKRYYDVRLVFAPEAVMGFFGGDPDNFTFPRYDLDMAFFRIYENGKPLKTSNFFKFSESGAKEGDLVFVIGNPGKTSRLNTYSQLEFNRDCSYPLALSLINNIVEIYKTMILKKPENKSQYLNPLFGYSNSQKVYANILKGMNDPYLMGKKKDFEDKFKEKVNKDPKLKSKYSKIWDEIESLQKEKAGIFKEAFAYNFRRTGFSSLFALASETVEYANLSKDKAEDQKKIENRLASLKAKSINPPDDIEMNYLVFQIGFLKSVFGESNPAFNKLTGKANPEDAAKAMLSKTILTNKDKFVALIEGGSEKILNSEDPLISFIAGIMKRMKEVREKYERINALENAKVQVLGMALYDVYKTSIPPDGTFTLRLSDGVVKTYPYNGTIAPPITTFYGLYDRYYSFGKQDPWELPERWQKPPKEFDLNTPFNFVATADTYGGNSGSPVVNKNLEVVGLNFDRNIDGMPREFIYTDETARNVCVHSQGILEALKDMYKAERIVKELKEGGIK